MTVDFVDATDVIFAKIGPEDLAQILDCAPNSIRQARMDRGKAGYRSPPGNWENAVRRLAIARANRLMKLVSELERQISESKKP